MASLGLPSLRTKAVRMWLSRKRGQRGAPCADRPSTWAGWLPPPPAGGPAARPTADRPAPVARPASRRRPGRGRRRGRPARRPLGAADGVPGGPANAQHQPQPVDEAEDRDGQVEGRQPVGAQPVGHKQGVGQDVAGQAQRAQHIQAHILEKLRFTPIPPKNVPERQKRAWADSF